MSELEPAETSSSSVTNRFFQWQLTLLASMYAGYAAFMLCRNTLISSSAAMMFNFFGGSIAEHYGWPVFLNGLLAISVAAMIMMTTFLALDARTSSVPATSDAAA